MSLGFFARRAIIFSIQIGWFPTQITMTRENGSWRASSTYVVDQQLSKGQSKNNMHISCLYFVVFLQGLEAHAYFNLAIFIVCV